MGLRDRGLRLAGYLTPPSDVTQEEDESADGYRIPNAQHTHSEHINSSPISCSLPVKKHDPTKSWTPMSTPAIPRSVEVDHPIIVSKPKDALVLDEVKISPKVFHIYHNKKSLDNIYL